MTRTVLITGTSSGLGRATAKLFQAKGWNIVATMRAPERETELGALDRVLVTRLDVQDATSIRSAVSGALMRSSTMPATAPTVRSRPTGPAVDRDPASASPSIGSRTKTASSVHRAKADAKSLSSVEETFVEWFKGAPAERVRSGF